MRLRQAFSLEAVRCTLWEDGRQKNKRKTFLNRLTTACGDRWTSNEVLKTCQRPVDRQRQLLTGHFNSHWIEALAIDVPWEQHHEQMLAKDRIHALARHIPSTETCQVQLYQHWDDANASPGWTRLHRQQLSTILYVTVALWTDCRQANCCNVAYWHMYVIVLHC